jgi:hypothetical protein
MAPERRRAPRVPLIASAEVVEPQTNARLKARISDLSLVGCYLDTTNCLPVGTEVRLHITHSDTTATALGVITHCLPNMGMGIRITDVQLDQHEKLDRWRAALVRH